MLNSLEEYSMKDTISIEEEISKREEIKDIREILNKYSDYYMSWGRYISYLLRTTGLSYEGLAKRCGFSKNTVKAWAKNNTLPKNREMFIKLGLGLKLERSQMDFLFQRFGKFPKLYSKSMEDAICLYVIQNGYQEELPPYEQYLTLKRHYMERIRQKNNRSKEKAFAWNETVEIDRELNGITNMEQFEQFIDQNASEFIFSYGELIRYIELYIKIENIEYDRKGVKWYDDAKGQMLRIGFDKMLSRLRNWGEVPNRRNLIALGIYLNMNLEEINELLRLAHMGKLCAKDKLEAILIFALVQVSVLYPEFEMTHIRLLSQHVEDEQLKKQYLLKYQELNEGFKSENSAGDLEELHYYIKHMLLEMESEDVGELLSLLPETLSQHGNAIN